MAVMIRQGGKVQKLFEAVMGKPLQIKKPKHGDVIVVNKPQINLGYTQGYG